MTNLAGYPSGVMQGNPGKSGKIQGLAGGFTPPDIGNIILWLDAAEGIGFGTGSNVASWADQSSNGNDVAQGTGANQPLLVTPGGGVLPLIRFDGVTEFMDRGAYINGILTQPICFFFVAKLNVVGAGDFLFDSFDNGVPNNRIAILNDSLGNWGLFAMTVVPFEAQDTAKHVFVAVFDFAASRFYIDGGASVPSFGDPGTNNMDGITIAVDFLNIANFVDADVMEITLFDKLLTNAEINRVGQFLADKHSLTWSDIDPMVADVTFFPLAGIISDIELVTLSTTTPAATIHFTTDGSPPTTGSPVFSAPFTLPLGVQTVRAFAVKAGFTDSNETQVTYTVQEIVADVTFVPPAGNIFDTDFITLATTTPVATIHFTTDGSPPTTGSPVFSAPFTLPVGVQTVRAFAIKIGLIDSAETQAIYTVSVATFDPLDISDIIGWWDAGQGITLNGMNVSQWDDQSVNANNLVQGTSTDQPFLDTGTDTTPFVDFDGVNDYLRILAYAGGQKTQPMSFAFVFQGTLQAGVNWVWDAAVTTDNMGFLTIAGAEVWQMFAGGGGALNFARDANKNIIMCIYNLTSSSFFINGGVAKITGTVGTDPQDGLIMGARTNTGNHGDPNIYDFTVYDKVLSTIELNDLGNYFATKHNLTWTTIP